MSRDEIQSALEYSAAVLLSERGFGPIRVEDLGGYGFIVRADMDGHTIALPFNVMELNSALDANGIRKLIESTIARMLPVYGRTAGCQ